MGLLDNANLSSMFNGVMDSYAQQQLPQGMLIPGNPYSYYAPSGAASFANAFAKGFSGANAKKEEREDKRRKQYMEDSMLNMQQEQLIDRQRSRKAGGMLATGMLGGDSGPNGRTPEEMTTKYGFNPMEYVDPRDVASLERSKEYVASRNEATRQRYATNIMLSGSPEAVTAYQNKFGVHPAVDADPRVMQTQMEGEQNRRLRETLAEVGRQKPDNVRYQTTVINTPNGPMVVAIDPTNPGARPVPIGPAVPREGMVGGGEFLPVDKTARQNLAEIVQSASDAARVRDEMYRAMGAEVDPKTGKTTFQAQPASPFSGGTGLLLGMLPDKIAARMDEEGQGLRSTLSNFSSQIMNALSGAAVSEQEKKRLEAFLPTASDSWETLRTKMDGYNGYLESKVDAWENAYGEQPVTKRVRGIIGGAAGGAGNDADAAADALIKKYGGLK